MLLRASTHLGLSLHHFLLEPLGLQLIRLEIGHRLLLLPDSHPLGLDELLFNADLLAFPAVLKVLTKRIPDVEEIVLGLDVPKRLGRVFRLELIKLHRPDEFPSAIVDAFVEFAEADATLEEEVAHAAGERLDVIVVLGLDLGFGLVDLVESLSESLRVAFLTLEVHVAAFLDVARLGKRKNGVRGSFKRDNLCTYRVSHC